MNAVPKDFNATFILVITRKVKARWFFASFSIGDGGAGAVLSDGQVVPLTKADGGEFAGQTVFLTTPQVYTDTAKLASRAHAGFCDGFKFLAAMTDGITDPIFPSDASFEDAQAWEVFRQKLAPVIDLTAPAEGMEAKLLQWLNFPSPGNHDDRTLVVAIPNTPAQP